MASQSRDALVRAIGQISQIGAGIDSKGLIKDLRAIETHLTNDGSLADVIKYLNKTIDSLGKVRTEADARVVAAQRIDVLLRAFLTLNNPPSRPLRQPLRSPRSGRSWRADWAMSSRPSLAARSTTTSS